MKDSIINAGSTIIGGAMNMIGAAQQRNFEREEAQKQRDWNEAMADKQNEWNLNMWNKQNEYNTPTAQLQRLRDAGLNPLFYGLDGTGNAGEITSAQPLGYDRASAGSFDNPLAAGINSAMDNAIKIAQISNIQADTAKKGEETLSEVQRREKIIADIDVAKQELNNMLAQEGLTKAQKAQVEKGLEWADKLNQATLNSKEAETKLSQSQKKRIDELLEGEKLIQSKTLEDFDRKWKKIDAEISKMSKETGLLKLDIENYALNHTNNGLLGTGISVQNLIRGIKEIKPNNNPDSIQAEADAMTTIVDNKY